MPRARGTPPRRKRIAPAITRAFLFSDLRDYTSFVEAKGDAAAARLLRDYRTLVRREIARHEGGEVKTEGDSFYVVFEAPSAALGCAVAILRAAEARNRRDPTAPLRVGVGVHAGETIPFDDQFVGSAVNIASRLAGKAGPGELVISDTFRGLVRTSQSFAMTDRGPQELKGVSEPMRAWSVTWQEQRPMTAARPPAIAGVPARRTSPGQLLCPIVVGRDPEVAVITARLAATSRGEGGAVLVAGEAGVGKSAFVRQTAEIATAFGFRVLIGLTHQSDRGLPYAPYISAMRSGFRALGHDELGRALERSAPDLAELFPELGRPPRAGDPSGIERHRLSVAFQHLFQAFARETPVLLVLEDLHWADEASLDLLQHLARELPGTRILALGTYRSDELHRRHALVGALAGLRWERTIAEIALERLTSPQTHEMIRATFAPGHPSVIVGDDLSDVLYARSEGNPFFTEELLKALVDSGGVYYTEGKGWERRPIGELQLPASIRDSVRGRCEQLPVEARETLSAAAVVGAHFGFDLLRSIRAVDDRALEAHLRMFVEQQLVSETRGEDDDGDEYAFRHALTRDVVYDDLLLRERKRLHRAVTEQLKRSDAVPPALLAHHLLAAGENERAVPVLLDAARRAFRTDAPREAAGHFARALEIGVPDGDVAAVLEQLAEAYDLFDVARSLKTALEAAAAYREANDTRGVSRALRLASREHWLRRELDDAERTARESIAVLREEECIELARAEAQLAHVRIAEGQHADAREVASRAIAMARKLGDPWAEANAAITWGLANLSEDPEASLAEIQRAIDLAIRHDLDAATVERGMSNALSQMTMLGRPLPERIKYASRAVTWAGEHGVEVRGAGWTVFVQWAWLDFESGDFEGVLAKTVELKRSGGEYESLEMQVVLARSGPEQARAGAQRVVAAEERRGQGQWAAAASLNALILALAGDVDEARSWLDRLNDLVIGQGAEKNVLPFLSWHVVAGALLCDDARFAALYERLPTVPIESFRRTRAERMRLLAALARGDPATAGSALGECWQILSSVGRSSEATLLTVVVAIYARRRGLALGVTWAEPLARAREHAGRAAATWWLEELTKTEMPR